MRSRIIELSNPHTKENPNASLSYLDGPAYCVMVGMPLSEADDEFDSENVGAWDSVIILAESREEAVEKVQAAVENVSGIRARIVLSEAQLRGLAANCRRVALRETPEDDPNA